MSIITLNGQTRTAPTGQSVADLMADVLGVRVREDGALPDGARLGVAVAINSVVVPRAGWTDRALADGDAVEVVSATQGG